MSATLPWLNVRPGDLVDPNFTRTSLPIVDGPAFTRTVDGTFVPEGEVVSGSILARAWRFPTKFLPNGAASVAPIFSVIFWAALAGVMYLALKKR